MRLNLFCMMLTLFSVESVISSEKIMLDHKNCIIRYERNRLINFLQPDSVEGMNIRSVLNHLSDTDKSIFCKGLEAESSSRNTIMPTEFTLPHKELSVKMESIGTKIRITIEEEDIDNM